MLRLELRADERPFAAAYAAAKVELAAFCSRDRCDGPTWGTCYAMVCAWAEMAVLSGMAIRGEPKGDYEAIVSQAIDAILKDVAVHAVGPDSFILCDAEWAYEEYGS